MLSAFRVRATFRRSFAFIFFMTLTAAIAFAAEAPRFVEKDGRWALLVDGQSYLMLGGQVHNSTAWPSELPATGTSLAESHAHHGRAADTWRPTATEQRTCY